MSNNTRRDGSMPGMSEIQNELQDLIRVLGGGLAPVETTLGTIRLTTQETTHPNQSGISPEETKTSMPAVENSSSQFVSGLTPVITEMAGLSTLGSRSPLGGNTASNPTTNTLATLWSPLINGLRSLLSGGEDPLSESSYIRYESPLPIHLRSGFRSATPWETGGVSYSSEGTPRVIQPDPAASIPPISIQVSAIDSRSFLDHSEEIADAVRQALLNSHRLTNVLTEL